ncbi:PD-(D/E)XK nuclease family protein [Flavobacterium sp.]|uniref:PDDEXK-like family protein n=1 Tax=Flavobacterium sp. TaxID=239 RepID=UPI00286E8E76|nr:PD-(D/E)XK nuclease family protein [Flavobacterium sp.]
MDKINNLLQQVSIIQKKYDEIATITGENFNIFSIMRAENDEVRTHSRIIAEFLNPKGMHRQGSVFLKLFFEEIKFLGAVKDDFEFDNAKVLVEEYLGMIDNEYSEGGFIDIVIKDSKNQIVIENKIYAKDQKGQLLRYKKNYPNCKMIYLTLEGNSPSEMSYIGTASKLELEEIILVSYRDEIKNWIEQCLEKTYSLPIIRETLIQYVHLIKKLTNQTTNIKMEEEILDNILNNPKNIQSALTIAGIGAEKVKIEICKKLFSQIQTKIGNDLITKNYNPDTYKFGEEGSGMWFSEKEDFKIGVLLWFSENYNLLLGVDVNSNSQEEIERIRTINGSTINWVKTIPFADNFNDLEWEDILEHKNINGIVAKIKHLIAEVESFKTE